MIGRTIAHYWILDELGAGASGKVYLAKDTKLDREVALKVLPPGLDDAEKLHRFEREARAVARLNHPNIVTLHSIEEAEGRRFLCMESVSGETLDEVIPEGGMELGAFLSVARQLASAIAAAHDAGIVHRDLKPGNLMVGETVKVLDFGLAKWRSEPSVVDGKPLTEEGHILGTLAYMAPEQVSGQEADPRSDVFALGILFFEMLTGTRPFLGPGLTTLIQDITTKVPPPVSETRDDVPTALVEIVQRCLEKDPADRYPNAAELSEALSELTDGLESAARDALIQPAEPRRRPILATGVVVALCLLVAAGLGLALRDRATHDAGSIDAPPTSSLRASDRILVLPFDVEGDDELVYLEQGLVDLLSTKLDGAGDLHSVDPRAVHGLDLDPEGVTVEAARSAATTFDAGLFVLGRLLAVGSRIQLTAALYETGAEVSPTGVSPAAQASVNGEAAQLFDLIDELTSQLLGSRLAGSGGRMARLASITTHSLPALKAYLNGESAFRTGRFQAAFDGFEQAVGIDPNFALAWYRLSTTAEWLSNDEMSRRGAEEAFRRSDRLSNHDRKLLEGFSAARRGAVHEAARLFREILATHPDDVEAWFQLAEIAFHFDPVDGESFSQAEDPWRQVIRYEPDHVVALLHLARLAAAKGELQELDELAQRFLELSPEGERTLEMRALQAFGHRDPAAMATVEADLRQAGDVTLYISARAIAHYIEDFEGARRLFRLMTEESRFQEIRRSGHILLANLEMASGRPLAAYRELQAADPLQYAAALEYEAFFATLPFRRPQEAALEAIARRLREWDAQSAQDVPVRVADGVHNGVHHLLKDYLLGLVEMTRGRRDVARDHVAALEAETDHLLAVDLATGLDAALADSDGDLAAAIDILEAQRRETWLERQVATSPFFSRARERFLRAQLLERSGELAEAERWYSSFEHHSVHALVFVAPSHEGRARIAERTGRHDLAIWHYDRFIDLWSDAEPELQPRVAAAKERLAYLAGSKG